MCWHDVFTWCVDTMCWDDEMRRDKLHNTQQTTAHSCVSDEEPRPQDGGSSGGCRWLLATQFVYVLQGEGPIYRPDKQINVKMFQENRKIHRWLAKIISSHASQSRKHGNIFEGQQNSEVSHSNKKKGAAIMKIYDNVLSSWFIISLSLVCRQYDGGTVFNIQHTSNFSYEWKVFVWAQPCMLYQCVCVCLALLWCRVQQHL